MNPIIRKMDALVVGGLKVRSADGGDLSHLGDRLARLRDESGDWGASPTAYGVVFDFQPETGQFGYLAGYPLSPGAPLPEGVSTMVIPPGDYAMFPTTLSQLMEAIEYATRVWLPGSAYRPVDAPEFELYDQQFRPGDPTSRIWYCLPVSPAGSPTPTPGQKADE